MKLFHEGRYQNLEANKDVIYEKIKGVCRGGEGRGQHHETKGDRAGKETMHMKKETAKAAFNGSKKETKKHSPS